MESRPSKEIISAGIVLALVSLLLQPAVAETKSHHSISTAKLLLAQQSDVSSVQVTGVKVTNTDKGIEVTLESSKPEALRPVIKSAENNYIADVPNAVLALPEGKEFSIANPVSGIVSVIVTQADANTVRVTVTGETGLPTAELFDSEEGLIFALAPIASTIPAPEQPEQPTSETPPAQPTAENNEPIELVVTGNQDQYRVEESSTATKIDAPLRDIPASVQVIPKEIIQDRQVVRLNELANNVSGVQQQSGYGGLSSSGYFIRGFESGFEGLRNGFKDFGFTSPRDVANIERVEFLKGPASVLYGSANNPGGVVNTITKKPLPDPSYRVGMTIGSYDFYRPTIDFTGPLTDDKSVLYRLNVAYENSGSFRDFIENESFFISPVVTVNISPKTSMTFEYEYQKYNYTFDRGLLPGNTFFQIPISRFLGEPGFNNAEFISNVFTYNLEHQFSDDWKFRQGFNVTSIRGNTRIARNTNFSEPFLEDDGQTLPRTSETSDEEQENISLQTEVSGKFNTGSIRHNVLLGVELAKYKFTYDFFSAPIASIDIFNPVYGAQPGTFDRSFAGEYGGDNLAVYFQNLIEFTPNLKLLAGGRFDWIDSFDRDPVSNTVNNEVSESNFSPRVGIVYQPTNSTSLYASWTNSFNPQFFGRSRTGESFKPETSEQFEVGIKQEFFDKRLSATLAYFDITKNNVLTPDPVDNNFSVQIGEQKSRGLELDIAGEILPGWKIIATYAYIDSSVSKDNDLERLNDRLSGVPFNSASLWTTYEFQKGSLAGLGFGLGLVYVDEREATLPNTIKIPSYVRTDASIFYRRDNWRAAINIKNLFDTEYYESQSFYLVPAAPLTVLGTISFEF
ncbi:TonB-dependent siderophore receptor [Anabaena sp. FACHB-709]|uniref:Ferrichrome-iron receptor n=2 Tax=Nostocaceae TaxID=1162 RepID=A0A1Z4KFU5_ANAVA|nr:MULTISPECIES: TonB-dependent siderophore receptor [Nostocaceae]BAY67835.1 ferrichrome-iron receptor [Trichormus variabilis NIES-23]HBW29584.1 TonB-dependent siderophore receptor [Nostoc sp. UBA8866]MBD2170075.1 TonB-dependent siderophore receptor [Anabaena cylindrica FACHB-318]MBD2261504.1 TonB-dependent siderophore receptor [Anabaena sp. FACHB-709]MBD2271088.1 TonB-dependent siderophore receptor [Nostoc sp. PCC 7120 = FACHB-418]